MAASTPPAGSVGFRNTIRQKASKASFKQVLKAPFQVPWPFVSPDDNADFISRLTSTLAQHRVGNVCRRGGKGSGKRRCPELCSGGAAACEGPAASSALPSDQPEVAAAVSRTETDRMSLSPYASEVVLGINAVTRAMEQPSAIRFVAVCRSVQPASLTRHLAAMAVQQNCPAVAIVGLSDALRPLLNVKSIAAVAFKKVDHQSVFDDLISHIAARCPRLSRIPYGTTQSEKLSGAGILSESHNPREEAAEALRGQGSVPGISADAPAIQVGECSTASPSSAATVSKGISLESDFTLSSKPTTSIRPLDTTQPERHVPDATLSGFSHLHIGKATAIPSLKRPLSSPNESAVLRHYLGGSIAGAAAYLSGDAKLAGHMLSKITASATSQVTYVKAKVAKMQGNPDRKYKSKKLKSK